MPTRENDRSRKLRILGLGRWMVRITMLPARAMPWRALTIKKALVESKREVGSSKNKMIWSWIMSMPILLSCQDFRVPFISYDCIGCISEPKLVDKLLDSLSFLRL